MSNKDITKKSATIRSTSTDEEFPGTFEVILSAPTLDRDGDTLMPEDWKLPLPDKITFDVDHGMSVATTVGSGVPSIDPETGNLIVQGTYSSLPRAQEVRTLVNEGHIDRTSVAFMTTPQKTKDGKTRNVRELLNGAFVAIPSNREAVILSSKSADVEEKSGARNSASDLDKIQQIHDASQVLGAACVSGAKSVKAATPDQEDAEYSVSDYLQIVDTAIDSAIELFESIDTTDLPAEIQQAINLIKNADIAIDELLEILGLPDVDVAEEAEATTGEDETPASGVKTPDAGAKSAPVVGDADSEVEALAVKLMANRFYN